MGHEHDRVERRIGARPAQHHAELVEHGKLARLEHARELLTQRGHPRFEGRAVNLRGIVARNRWDAQEDAEAFHGIVAGFVRARRERLTCGALGFNSELFSAHAAAVAPRATPAAPNAAPAIFTLFRMISPRNTKRCAALRGQRTLSPRQPSKIVALHHGGVLRNCIVIARNQAVDEAGEERLTP